MKILKSKKAMAIIIGSIIILLIVIGGVAYLDRGNSENVALSQNDDEGYKEVDAQMYISVPGNLEVSDDGITISEGPYVEENTLITVIAINEVTGWCKVKYDNNLGETVTYYIKYDRLSNKNSEGETLENAISEEVIEKIETNISNNNQPDSPVNSSSGASENSNGNTTSSSNIATTGNNGNDNSIKIANLELQIQQKNYSIQEQNNSIISFQQKKSNLNLTLEQHRADLANAQIALENAKNNKTLRVYREGLGFVYETDPAAIAKAQDNVDFYQSLVNDYENMILDIDNQIIKLNNNISILKSEINILQVQIEKLK